ncbi:F0F1 ATP synthase subunit A [Glycocaulis alkaliphilus]|uniref:ATP synthase subunit a n=1 Tax=Glycocaulis alkaliphilus TaxID=1434191 RepID=A0A3T0E940_9PROT|nr:F0F1 ATP synthase subunit A [Glycocaulis alkaliphilus]AZU03716.1 F0F1 ATP synthase subunit A [Glycocaulis alkaliphilus]GGB83405.1 ATP synthase subunit a [Glycocaulis alkaliphilus]
MADTNPIKQFEIHPIAELSVGGLDLSFTNSSYFMVAAVALTVGLLALATSRATLVPGRAQSVAELLYEFVAGMIRSTAGNDGLRFFPFVFTLFIFILMGNMLGMMPYFPAPDFHGFTFTSHIIVTFALALAVMSVLVGFGIFKNGLKFFKIFVPSGVPIAILPFVIVIEIISFISRPVTLGVRLFANMLAGHILLKVFAGFIIMLGSVGALGAVGAVAPLIMVVALTALEFLVAFLQAYVFAVLTCIYLSDALHPGHH